MGGKKVNCPVDMISRHLPGPVSRRSFLHRLGGGFGGVVMQALLQQEARAGRKVEIDPLNPFKPRVPDFPARAKSVIFLYMVGGPGQMDTFDYKPVLQKLHGKKLPDSIRQAILATKHANVLHGCKDEILGSPWGWKQ